jgi:hypothetical protein
MASPIRTGTLVAKLKSDATTRGETAVCRSSGKVPHGTDNGFVSFE